MKALSIHQPWAYFILYGGKRYENRDWSLHNPGRKFRGEFYIHASKGGSRPEFDAACMFALRAGVKKLPDYDRVLRGGIVGKARVVDFVTRADSPWFMGPAALQLEEVQEVDFVPCKGMLGFFTPEI